MDSIKQSMNCDTQPSIYAFAQQSVLTSLSSMTYDKGYRQLETYWILTTALLMR